MLLVAGIFRSDGRVQDPGDKLCLAGVLTSGIRPFSRFGLNYLRNGVLCLWAVGDRSSVTRPSLPLFQSTLSLTGANSVKSEQPPGLSHLASVEAKVGSVSRLPALWRFSAALCMWCVLVLVCVGGASQYSVPCGV